jgi:hypothetical protein
VVLVEEEASDGKAGPLGDLKKVGSFMESSSNKDPTEVTIGESRMVVGGASSDWISPE